MSGALKVRTSTNPDVWTTIGGGPFATDAETIAGTVTDKAVTPAGLNAALPIFDVRSFGAKGDGIADDTAAAQAAIAAAASAGGGRVLFPAGDYKLTADLNIAVDDVELVGVGAASNLVFTSSGIHLNGIGVLRYGQGISDLHVTRTGTTGPAIRVSGGSSLATVRWKISGVHVMASSGPGLLIDGSYIGDLFGCYFQMSQVGVEVKLGGSVAGNAIHFFGGEIYGNVVAVKLGSANNITFHAVTIEGNGSGITIGAACKGIFFDGCYFEANTDFDVTVGPDPGTTCQGITFVGCWFYCGPARPNSIILKRSLGTFLAGNFWDGYNAAPVRVDEAAAGAVDGHEWGNRADDGFGVVNLVAGVNWQKLDWAAGYPAYDSRYLGRPHLYLPGTIGNSVSAPDPPQLAGATQLDIRWIERPVVYTNQVLITQSTGYGSNASFVMVALTGQPNINFTTFTDGTTASPTITAAARPAIGQVGAGRLTWRSSDGRMQVFTKATADVAAMLDNTGWTQSGSNATGLTTPLFNSTAQLRIGSYGNDQGPLQSGMLAMSVATTIDGIPFALWRADPQARQYTDDYGTRWTVNGTAWEWRDGNGLQIGGPQPSDIITGTGFPEGVVAAPIGQRYIDTVATNGAIEWIKASGSGNTGWQVTHADTGTRNIATLLDATWKISGTAGLLRLRRQNYTVTLAARLQRMNAGGNYSNIGMVCSLPTGFHMGSMDPFCTVGEAMLATSKGIGVPNGLIGGDRLDLNFPGFAGTWLANEEVALHAQWVTEQAWPATLPGV